MNAGIFVLLVAGLAMVGPFATDTFLPSLPAIAAHFAVTPATTQLTLSVYLAAYAVASLVHGTLSDTYGRRPVVLASLGVFTAASVGAALAPSFGWLIACRALQGATAGAGMVVGQAATRDRYQGADAQKMLTIVMVVFGLAPALAPIIGGWLQTWVGWRANFGLMGGLSALLIAGCLASLPETLPREQRRPFHLRSIAADYAAALRHGPFMLRALAVGLAFGGLALYISAAADFVMNVLHLPETAFGWLFMPLVAGLMVGSAVSGRLAASVAPGRLIGIGYLTMGAGLTLNVGYHALAASPTVPWAVLPLALYTFGLAFALPGMTLQTLALFPAQRGLAGSLQNFVQMLVFAGLSSVLAPVLFGSGLSLALGATAVVGTSLVCWTVAERLKRTPGVDAASPASAAGRSG